MNTFFAYYVLYLVGGVAITAALFFWAVRAGQFRDQKRIRFAPLGDEAPVPVTAETAKWPAGMKLTIFLATSGVVSLAICAVLVAILE